ncbi:alpha/beta hydrolase [Amycolatopsis cynarae]|uniref:Alpha/beta hydrolase n=1 Tax=Amycolatopsis cynarae TaxID=2995223 RepID=A0ABY7B232_9PSEU|nr:alpha/beta hydrolase [Amycolatopsis sp. HUAS 11-8]WAL66355.1 alpha/beta hydrolase [Amycolatopsis sp. HUAS 11-8]
MAKVNGLAYDEAGGGPAVVLVHAGVGDRRMWEHQFAALSRRYRVIRYDWRGRGESDDAAGEVTHYRDLLGLLDALDVGRAALVGCSMGGSYALEAALAEPDRVSALALISSGLSGHEWPPEFHALVAERVHGCVPEERLRRYAVGGAEVDPADVAAMAEAQGRLTVVGPDRDPADLDPRVWALALDMLRLVFRREWSGPRVVERHSSPGARLGEVAAPTLVINGLSDVPAIQAVSDLLSAGIPGARRLDLPDTGHLPPVERAAEVTEALTRFLAAEHSG